MTRAHSADPTRDPLPNRVARAWGEEIQARREKYGFTQVQLAERVGVHQTTVSQWERGEVSPSPKAQARLVRELGIDPLTLHRLVTRGAA